MNVGLAALPAVELSPQFEARFWARIARESDLDAGPSRVHTFLRGLLGAGVLAAAAAALWIFVRTPPPAESDPSDWLIAADAEGFELLQEDVELLALMDILEEWDGTAS